MIVAFLYAIFVLPKLLTGVFDGVVARPMDAPDFDGLQELADHWALFAQQALHYELPDHSLYHYSSSPYGEFDQFFKAHVNPSSSSGPVNLQLAPEPRLGTLYEAESSSLSARNALWQKQETDDYRKGKHVMQEPVHLPGGNMGPDANPSDSSRVDSHTQSNVLASVQQSVMEGSHLLLHKNYDIATTYFLTEEERSLALKKISDQLLQLFSSKKNIKLVRGQISLDNRINPSLEDFRNILRLNLYAYAKDYHKVTDDLFLTKLGPTSGFYERMVKPLNKGQKDRYMQAWYAKNVGNFTFIHYLGTISVKSRQQMNNILNHLPAFGGFYRYMWPDQTRFFVIRKGELYLHPRNRLDGSEA